ncbi:hypothetical protein [Yersinia enterocolitica]|uniref:hypothetical protein n=1 Tax=Yersinia enterocolitica TaxID=630 RepID=UPI003D02A14D
MIYVNFRDETNTEIAASFASPQSPDAYLFLGEIEENDPRHIEYLSKFTISKTPEIE